MKHTTFLATPFSETSLYTFLKKYEYSSRFLDYFQTMGLHFFN